MLNNIDEKELSNSQVNIVLKKEESNEESIVIPFREMLRGLKRFAVLWVAAAVLLALLVSTGIALFSHQLSSAPVALIGFDYDGIQWGKAPDGGDFDINSIKSPVVIEKALTSLGYSTNYVESVRKAISIDGIMPDEAIDKITVYRSAYEKTGNLQAADAMLGVDYNCTQYLVTFNFDKTPFGDDEAAQVINTVLDCYSDYFFETYSSNETIGNAGLAVDYTEYDYLISVDNYSDVLNTLRSTVDGLKYTDFRSTKSGYSFSDLSDAISIVDAYEADTLAAYIISNSVVRDKESMISYYEYRISEIERSKKSAQEHLGAINASIEAYEKDTVVMYDGTAEDALSYTTSSDKYDSLFTQKAQAQAVVSRYTQRIAECKSRLDAVKKLGSRSADPDETAIVEERLGVLSESVDKLVEDVNTTVLEYNKSVRFANAYSVLVSADVMTQSYVSMLLKNILMPLVLGEAALFFVYIGASVVYGFVVDSRKRRAEEEAKASSEN